MTTRKAKTKRYAQVSESRPGAPDFAEDDLKQIPCGNDNKRNKDDSRFSAGMTIRKAKTKRYAQVSESRPWGTRLC
jgi:hypothetical protein